MDKWRLFAPAEDWQHPLEVEESALSLLTTLAERLGLRVSRDDAQRKFYLGVGPAPSVKPAVTAGEGVKYPSGVEIPKAVLSVAEAARYGTTGIYTAAPLLAARPTERLSAHFTAGEFMCHDLSYPYLRVSPELVRKLEKIREQLKGAPLTILSAFRPPAYNRSVDGASNSAHIDGLAADIVAAGFSTEALRGVCEAVIGEDGGVGFYPAKQFVHIDVRGYGARWQV